METDICLVYVMKMQVCFTWSSSMLWKCMYAMIWYEIQVWHVMHLKHVMICCKNIMYTLSCCIGHNEGCQLNILSIAIIMELTDGLMNGSVSTNYDLWYIWPTVLWNGSLSMNSDKGTYVGQIMINYEPWPTDLWNGSVLWNNRQCSPDQCIRIISYSNNKWICIC